MCDICVEKPTLASLVDRFRTVSLNQYNMDGHDWAEMINEIIKDAQSIGYSLNDLRAANKSMN